MGPLEELSTRGLAPGERLPFWNDVAERMLAPIRVEAADPATFEARLYRKRFRDCEILSPCSAPARIFSSPEHEQAGVLNLQVQHRGRSTNHTAGRTSILEEGDFLLYDPSLPLWLSFEEPTQAIVLRLPLATVEERLPHLKRMAGIRMEGRNGPGAVFSNFVRTAWTELQSEDGDWVDGFSDVLWPLLDLTYAGQRAAIEDTSKRDERRQRLFAVVDAELCDPDLDTRRIARRMGVSTRYVQMLFAELATTPTAFVQGRRLELAADRLKREGARASITEVAFDVGFNDLSSFCRAFRRRFDVSARDYRAGIRRRRLDS